MANPYMIVLQLQLLDSNSTGSVLLQQLGNQTALVSNSYPIQNSHFITPVTSGFSTAYSF
jgi:hypothetical protein